VPKDIINYGGKYNFKVPYKPLTEMTLDELQKLKAEWYRQAKESGLVEDCQRVADNNLTAKYQSSVFQVDSDGHENLCVRVNGQAVLNSPVNRCIPGEWCRQIRLLLEEFDAKNRQSLIDELTLIKDWDKKGF
jgi:hypothetical protein